MSTRRLRDLGGADPYRLLGIGVDADKDMILRAYRRRIREVHPDAPAGNEEEAKLLHTARDILLDARTRAEYDRLQIDPVTTIDEAPAASAWDDDDIVAGPGVSPELDTWTQYKPPDPYPYAYPPQPWPTPTPAPYAWQYPSDGPPRKIDTNMTMSIISAFVFWPLAIPAIVASAKVGPALRVGDYVTARRAAADSKKWSRLALIVGCASIGLCVLCCCVGFMIQNLGPTSTTSP